MKEWEQFDIFGIFAEVFGHPWTWVTHASGNNKTKRTTGDRERGRAKKKNTNGGV